MNECTCQNENIYRFIDKDKLIQFLTTPEMWRENGMYDLTGWAICYQDLKDKVEAGFFSFQRGGE